MSEILDRLEEWRDYQGGEWVARCPAHDDGKPSLWINLKSNGMVGLACRAGCRFEDIVAALDLLPRHLFNVDAEGLAVVAEARPEPVSPFLTAGLRVWLDSLPAGQDDAPAAVAYAQKRFGLAAAEQVRLGLRWWPGPQPCPEWVPTSFVRYPRLVVPMADFAGVARGAQGRDLSGRCPVRWISLANPDGFEWQRFGVFPGPDPGAPWVIAEGLSDPLAVVADGFNVVGVRGAALLNNDPATLDALAAGLAGRDVRVCGDNDRSGREFARTILAALNEREVPARQLTLPAGFKDYAVWRETR
ncbi:toprim domain-containing protein [Kitasatospora sp. NBC_01302]|uniref:toprim domain-containing protein n=1 Tax=Kitasatospora sp. NBC_01302 TaxID=2903575 RepID=UPI002E1076CD|nr:toprim domain-containing protein [Kitasatospora sp. NBC_01302]